MSFFKKKMPATSLAVLLMGYTITGDAFSDDAGRIALGPHGISVKDGSNVLPEDVDRTHWDHLSSRDSLIIALATMFLRGYAVSIWVNNLIKSKQACEAVLKEFKGYWAGWSHEGGTDYLHLYEVSTDIYSAAAFSIEFENKLREGPANLLAWLSPSPIDNFITEFVSKLGVGQANRGEQDVSKMLEQIGTEFSNRCDPFDVIRDPLRSELAKRGEATFIEATNVITNLLESVLEKYRIIAT